MIAFPSPAHLGAAGHVHSHADPHRGLKPVIDGKIKPEQLEDFMDAELKAKSSKAQHPAKRPAGALHPQRTEGSSP